MLDDVVSPSHMTAIQLARRGEYVSEALDQQMPKPRTWINCRNERHDERFDRRGSPIRCSPTACGLHGSSALWKKKEK